MTIAIGYLVSAAIAIVALWAIAGRNFIVVRDPQVNLADQGGRHVGILSGLAGYAVTGMVLLVTLGRSLPDTSSTTYTTVVTMFFVSWMAFSAAAFLFANIADPRPLPNPGPPGEPRDFDVPAGHFAGAAATLEFAFGLGWLALRPLFQAFGLQRLADLVAIILVGVALASYGLVAHHLQRSGYGPGRILVAVPVLSVVAVVIYGLIVGIAGLRSEAATLDLIVVGFSVGAAAFFGVVTLTITGSWRRSTRFMARFGPYLILAYVQGVILLVGFLLLSVLGLA